MASRKKPNLKLVKDKPRKRPRCKAKTAAGNRCKRPAYKNGACNLRSHQEQVRGVKPGAVSRREPKKHEAHCKACNSEHREYVEKEWIAGALDDAEAAKRIPCSKRAWQRHCAYVRLYEARVNEGLAPLLFKVIDKAILKGMPRLGDAVAAAGLLNKIVQGGEKIIIEAVDRLREQERGKLFQALDEIAQMDEPQTPAQFIEILSAKLAEGGQEDGRVH